MSQFGKLYSKFYDLMYEDKSYLSEVEYVVSLLPTDARKKSLLDIGCGTGKHAEIFFDKGFSVHGIDLSSEMLDLARERNKSKSSDDISFSLGNSRTFSIDKKFDVIVSLFHVMSYQNDNTALAETLNQIKNHLNPGGYFIFDFWYGPAVLSDLPATRVKRLSNQDIKVTRLAEPELKVASNIVEVNYEIHIDDLLSGDKVVKKETHSMRYFFDPELELILSQLGFEVIDKYEWLTNEEPKLSSWNVVWVVKG
ncbi:class I SAM-dependent DNA methyltransferase [Vibrio hepatarius]|uniref:class I SAM-dependent DNA methyltransferase n=1 Tax=Vibrio hepatarius TaxID=171383 RepID=UPI001C094779|nr:class I SAM-dependent methyltransferase [Vibrio hepatarius]MBU2896878.1 methyltransferase domain-containing protein [Vibrio hepatarius]